VEWLRSRASQWKEEIQLLEEEMHCAIKFCEWKALWWDEQRHNRPNLELAHLVEGVSAYVAEQAQSEHERAVNWAAQWAEIHKTAGTVLTQYLTDEVVPQVEAIHIMIEDEDEDDDSDVYD